MQETIKAVSKYEGIPNIVKADNGKIYRLSFFDTKNRFIKFKVIEPKEHNGSLYYRINGQRYSEYKLKVLEKRIDRKIDLERKVYK